MSAVTMWSVTVTDGHLVAHTRSFGGSGLGSRRRFCGSRLSWGGVGGRSWFLFLLFWFLRLGSSGLQLVGEVLEGLLDCWEEGSAYRVIRIGGAGRAVTYRKACWASGRWLKVDILQVCWMGFAREQLMRMLAGYGRFEDIFAGWNKR